MQTTVARVYFKTSAQKQKKSNCLITLIRNTATIAVAGFLGCLEKKRQNNKQPKNANLNLKHIQNRLKRFVKHFKGEGAVRGE